MKAFRLLVGLWVGAGLLLGDTIQGGSEKIPAHSLYWQQRSSHFQRLPNDTGEIIFLGDSITEGANWSEMFQDLRIKNRGISGDVTAGVLDRLEEVVESRPQKIFLMIGINDLAEGLTKEEVVANIRRIISRIRRKSAGTRIYLQSLLPVNRGFLQFPDHTDKSAEITAINRVLKRWGEEADITYVDLYSHFADQEGRLKPEYTNDGLHLTGDGYALWQRLVEPHIK